MNNKINLDSRLAMCANFVRNNVKIADIGTDHAYLPIWLCQVGKCPAAIAADINPEPLSRGKIAIENHNAQELVKTRLSDGLENILENEAEDFVIAGMGGELIASIISKCSFAKNPEKHFILQPMTRSEFLIKFLCENGFEIIKQDCCVASGKCYTVISTSYCGKIQKYDEIFYYTGILDPKTNDLHRKFVEKNIRHLKKQGNGNIHYLHIAQKLEDFLND